MIPEALKAVNRRTISLLTTDVKSRKLIGVIRETREEALKCLNIGNVLARRLNATWNIVLPTDQEARLMGRSRLMSKSVRLQTEKLVHVGQGSWHIGCPWTSVKTGWGPFC